MSILKLLGIGGDGKDEEVKIEETPEEIEEHAKDLEAQSKLARVEASHADAMAKKYNAEAREAVAKNRHDAVTGEKSKKKKGWALSNYKLRDLAIVGVILLILIIAMVSRC